MTAVYFIWLILPRRTPQRHLDAPRNKGQPESGFLETDLLLRWLPRVVGVWPARMLSSRVLPGKSQQMQITAVACSAHPTLHIELSKNGRQLTARRGIGLETSILFAKEGANVLMTDISQEALDKALAKVKQLVPDAGRVETKVRAPADTLKFCPH
jgi:hypothetical protein